MGKIGCQSPWIPAGVPGVVAVSLTLKEFWRSRPSRRANHEVRHQPRLGRVFVGNLVYQVIDSCRSIIPESVTGGFRISFEVVNHPVGYPRRILIGGPVAQECPLA